MNPTLIIVGAVMLAICVFIFAGAIRAEQWYLHYTGKSRADKLKIANAPKDERTNTTPEEREANRDAVRETDKKAPGDGWFVLTALAAFLGVSILFFVPFLIPIFAFIMLYFMCKVKSTGQKNGITHFTIWTVIIGAGVFSIGALALLGVGIFAQQPTPAQKAARTANSIEKLLAAVRATGVGSSGNVLGEGSATIP